MASIRDVPVREALDARTPVDVDATLRIFLGCGSSDKAPAAADRLREQAQSIVVCRPAVSLPRRDPKSAAIPRFLRGGVNSNEPPHIKGPSALGPLSDQADAIRRDRMAAAVTTECDPRKERSQRSPKSLPIGGLGDVKHGHVELPLGDKSLRGPDQRRASALLAPLHAIGWLWRVSHRAPLVRKEDIKYEYFVIAP